MTQFEKELLKNSIYTAYSISDMSRKMLKILASEDTGHIGDQAESKVVTVIQDYLESLDTEDKYEFEICEIMEKIILMITENNSDAVIETIEAFEKKFKKAKK